MDIHQIKREVQWYGEEIQMRKRDLDQAKRNVTELESKVRDLDQSKRKVMNLEDKIRENERKLEQYKRDLSTAEREEQQKKK